MLKSDKIKKAVQAMAAQLSPSGEYVDEGMHASIYNNLASKPSPMLDLLQQGPPPEIDETPMGEVELELLIEEMKRRGIR